MKNYKLTLLAWVIGIASCVTTQAQEQTNQFLMNWHATGYTTNARGQIIATNINQQTLINKVAYDNGLDPKDLVFVYRVEKRDTAVVWKSNGVFVSDVYQMEYTYQDITNSAGTTDFIQSLLNDEYHTNAIGSTFGVETRSYDRDGYIRTYNYHGTFQCSFPEDNVVFSGSFSTGGRVLLTASDD